MLKQGGWRLLQAGCKKPYRLQIKLVTGVETRDLMTIFVKLCRSAAFFTFIKILKGLYLFELQEKEYFVDLAYLLLYSSGCSYS